MKNSPAKKQNKSVKYGDTFLIGGRHVVACGDARDAELVKRAVGEKKIVAVICDPPYGIRAVESKEGFAQLSLPKKILNDDITDETEYATFTKNWITPVLPHLTRKNSFYVFNADPMIFALREGMKNAGLTFSQLLVWAKTQAVIGRKDYAIQHELIAFGWYGRHAFRKIKDRSLLVHPKPAKSPYHPTTKPVALIRRLILNSTAMHDVVYDPFAGSGTCLLAAHSIERSSVLIERDEVYVRSMLQRFEHAGLAAHKLP